jgi:hypothetical protein
MPKPNSDRRSYSASATGGNRPPGGTRFAKVAARQLIRLSRCRHDDITLLRLCSRFRSLERIIQASWTEEDEESWQDALEEQEILSAKIGAHRPRTLYEFQEVARALLGWTKGMPLDDIADLSGRDSYLLCFLLTSLVNGS